MELHRIILVTLALLPFNVCFGMENTSTPSTKSLTTLPSLSALPWRPVARPQAYKKYPRRLAPQQKVIVQPTEIRAPKKIDYDAIMLEVENFLDTTADCYEKLSEECFTTIEEDFKKKFGYAIPTSPNDYKKIDFKSFVTNNKMFDNVQNFPTKKISPWAIEKITKKVKKHLLHKEQEEIRLIREKIVEQERLCREKTAENQRLIQKNKKLERINKEKQFIQKKREAAERQQQIAQRIIDAQKKEAAAKKAAQQTTKTKQPAQRPVKSILQQKLDIKRMLKTSPQYKRYNCQSDAQLKNILSNRCYRRETCCFFKKLNNHAAIHYVAGTNELIILIGDEIFDYDFDRCDYDHS